MDWGVRISGEKLAATGGHVSARAGGQATFRVELSDWKVNASVPASTFNAVIPKGAVKIEFKLNSPAPTK